MFTKLSLALLNLCSIPFIGDNLLCVHYGFSVGFGECSASRGVSDIIFCLSTQKFKEVEAKRRVVMHHDQATYLLLN